MNELPRTAAQIRKLRISLGLSEPDLDRIVGVPHPTTYDIERGKCLPRLSTILAFMQALHRLNKERSAGKSRPYRYLRRAERGVANRQSRDS